MSEQQDGEQSTREQLLADFAELYYVDRLTQQQIAERAGINRSSVSRMLSEAQDRGIVRVTIARPLHLDLALGSKMTDRFSSLVETRVVTIPDEPRRLMPMLGQAGAALMAELVEDKMVIGVTWGRTLHAVVRELQPQAVQDVKVVQLAGAVAAVSGSPAEIIATLGHKLKAEVVRLNSPLLVDSRSTARALAADPSNRYAIDLGRSCDIVLVGVGAMDERFSSLFIGGHISHEDMQSLRNEHAVADVDGHPIDAQGEPVGRTITDRLVSVHREDLLRTPIRLGIAGGLHKTQAIHAALTGGYFTHLVTDSPTARVVLHGSEA